VKVRALGPLVLEGEAARGTVKGRSKPLELLKALVALGGSDVPEARVVELVWPEADGDLGRQRLKYTLHALRGLLGPDAVSLEKGLLSLDPRRVWLDAWELDRQLDRLGAALDRRRAGDARDALARAVALRRAPLLEGEAAPWAAAARERLDARVIRLVLRAAELLRDDPAARPDLERAAELFANDARVPRALHRAHGTA
jgi:two-component SAPR family response regulator